MATALSSAPATVERSRSTTPALGPVADLEEHLSPDWWRGLFGALYLKTDGDVVENDANTEAEVAMLIDAADIGTEDSVLDLCCGQGRHALELARLGYTKVAGIDRSRYLIRLARRRARERGLAVAFREGDARRLAVPAASLDCVAVMGNSFGYFEDAAEDGKVLAAIRRALRPGGRVALDITDGGWMAAHFEPRSWEWIDREHFVCRERSLASDQRRLITREIVTHVARGVIADQFFAERLYGRAEIKALLAAAGFVNVRFHGMVRASSERNQDLGMMARRLFLTAERPREKRAGPPTDARAKQSLKVSVALGDPRLPDPVKRGGRFNAEDFDTVRRLKDALRSIDGIAVDYLDRHASLAADLARGSRDLVLNLCDEGFGNDALKELHVPALLEMSGAPYTGAGPAALGLCYDKGLVRLIAQGLGVPVPDEHCVMPGAAAPDGPPMLPALLKPATGDSSIGITADAVVRDAAAFASRLAALRAEFPDRTILVQEFLEGQEYTVGLIGNRAGGFTALPVLEVDYAALPAELPRILGYESKWHPESPYWSKIGYRAAGLGDEQRRALIEHSGRLFERLGCRDYARFDFRADAAGTIKLLEVNPNPGWCWDGKLNLMAELAGLSYADLLAAIIDAACARLGLVRPSNRASGERRAA